MTYFASIEKQQQEIEAILKERIEAAQKERAQVREAIATIDAKIKTVLSQGAASGLDDNKRPKETLEQISTAISEMEYTHATTSQSAAQERELLRNLQKLRQKKKTLGAYSQMQSEIDVLKAKRATIVTELNSKDEVLDELQLGLRRVRTAMTLHVGISDVISKLYAVPEDRVPQVIGKGGANLRQIETEYGVSIESERYASNELNILGTPGAIYLAMQAIDTIVNTISDEFTTSEQSIICLTMDKAALLQDLQARYNVRIETNRAKKTCKIVGLQSVVEIVKAEIMSFNSSREEIAIDLSMLPFIVGKGGVVVRGIGEENHVHIDINRDESKIVVMGLRDGVSKAVSIIRSIADENKKIEESIQIEKQVMIGCIIGAGGNTIRNLQTHLSVQLTTQKGTDKDTLLISGTTAKVLAAKQHVLSVIEEYARNSEIINVPADCMPIVLGKKGSRINALREEHSTVNIDVDNNSIRICGGTQEARLKAKEVIDDILASNWSSSIPCEADLGIVLKSGKGADIRQQLLTTLDLNVDIDTENAVVKLRGYKEKVEKGIVLIQTFLAGFQTLVIDLTDEDCASLMNGSNPGATETKAEKDTVTSAASTVTTTAAAVATATAAAASVAPLESLIYSPTKYVETKYNVEVYINRKECKLRLRGPQAAIEAGKAHILGILNGNPSVGSILIPIDPLLYATLIGKSGSNLKKMESELSVKFDILKSKCLLRIRGSPETVEKAKTSVIEFMDNVRASTTINVPSGINGKELDRTIELFTALYNDAYFTVNTQATPKVLTIRGSLLLIEEAKSLIEDYFNNSSTAIVKLPQQYVETHRFERAWKKIREVCGVGLDILSSANSTTEIPRFEIKLSGTVEAVNKGKKLLYDALMTILPQSTFCVMYMTGDQLKSLALQKHIRDVTSIPQLEDLTIDRQLGCIRYMSSIPACVDYVTHIIQQKLSIWDQTHHIIGPLDGPYVWPSLVGKNGENLANVEKSIGADSISLNKSTLTIIVECIDTQKAPTVIQNLNEKLEKIRTEYFEMELDDNLIRAIIGKKGETIAKFRSELQVSIDLDGKTLKVSGASKDIVQTAKDKLTEFIEEEKQRNYSRIIYVPVGLVPRLIGLKGANIREIQQSTDTKIDLDKDTERGTIRGSVESVNAAVKAIQAYFDSEGVEIDIEDIPPAPSQVITTEIESKLEQVEHEPESSSADGKQKLPPGAQPKLGLPLNKSLSKSALKRLKKKEKQTQNVNPSDSTENHIKLANTIMEEESDEEVEEEKPFTPTFVPSAPIRESVINGYPIDLNEISVPISSSLQPATPMKESIVAPIVPLSQQFASTVSMNIPMQMQSVSGNAPSLATTLPAAPPAVSKHSFAIDEPVPRQSYLPQTQPFAQPTSANSNNSLNSFDGSASNNGAPATNAISPTDLLLSILLGRTQTNTSAESAIFSVLNGGKIPSSMENTANLSGMQASVGNTNSFAQSAMASPVTSGNTATNPSTAKPQSSTPQTIPSQQPATPSQQMNLPQQKQATNAQQLGGLQQQQHQQQQQQQQQQNSAAGMGYNFNSHMPMQIQQQAQQPFFSPFAAAYAPPGFSAYSQPQNDMSYQYFAQNVGGDYGFPLSQGVDNRSNIGMKPAPIAGGKGTTQQPDYFNGNSYGMRGNTNTSSFFAPPGFNGYPMGNQMQSASITSNVGYYPTVGSVGRPNYPQMQQGYSSQSFSQPYASQPGAQGYTPTQHMNTQGQQMQSLYSNPSTTSPSPGKSLGGKNSANNSSNGNLNQDDRGSNYYRGNTSKSGPY